MTEEEFRFVDPSDERFVKFITSTMKAVIDSELDSSAMFGGRHQLSFSGLTYVLAMMTEANPGSTTKRDVRQDAEGLARALRIQAEHFREVHAQTGTHLLTHWLGEGPAVN